MQNKQNVGFISVAPSRTEGLVELQAAALEATANAVVITNQTGTVIWVNSAFEQLTGHGCGNSGTKHACTQIGPELTGDIR
jgi:hypothetical protein